MIVLHFAEGTAQHGVLEVAGTIKGGDFAGERLANAEMARAPSDALTESDEAGRNSAFGYGLFAEVNIAFEMDFHRAGEIETALGGSVDARFCGQLDHNLIFLLLQKYQIIGVMSRCTS